MFMYTTKNIADVSLKASHERLVSALLEKLSDAKNKGSARPLITHKLFGTRNFCN